MLVSQDVSWRLREGVNEGTPRQTKDPDEPAHSGAAPFT